MEYNFIDCLMKSKIVVNKYNKFIVDTSIITIGINKYELKDKSL